MKTKHVLHVEIEVDHDRPRNRFGVKIDYNLDGKTETFFVVENFSGALRAVANHLETAADAADQQGDN